MGKTTKAPKQVPANPSGAGLFAARSGIDPTLSALFSTSAGPVKREDRKSQKADKHDKPAAGSKEVEKSDDEESNSDQDNQEEDDEELSELDDEELDDGDEDEDKDEEDEDESEDEKDALLDGEAVGVVDGEVEMAQPDDTIADIEESSRKRKRNRNNDDLEDVYMQKLAKEEAKEEAQRDAERKTKRTKVDPAANATNTPDDDDYIPPQHESLAPTTSSEATSLEQAARTVFLGNVSSSAITSKSAKKTLMTHLSSFLATLPTTAAANDTPHKLESLRFRSVAFSSSVPKKAAFARKDIMDSTTKSANAYAVYSTKTASREAALRLNGTVVLDRHLRVDEVAHPSQTDHRRCVFVGNLGFVDDASAMDAGMAEADGQKRKPKKGPPGDVEEGLWREFGKVGKVESVRVVRDAKTRVGKGFAYVQFDDANAVEAALLYNDKKFPPLLPRSLRVVRAKKPSIARKTSNFYQEQDGAASSDRQPRRNAGAKPTAEQSSMAGRAKKLLGRAGGAQTVRSAGPGTGANAGMVERKGQVGEVRIERESAPKAMPGGIRKPESFVFEGHRASSTQGNKHLRLGGGGGGKKSKGKPRTRSANRGAEWKKKGGK